MSEGAGIATGVLVFVGFVILYALGAAYTAKVARDRQRPKELEAEHQRKRLDAAEAELIRLRERLQRLEGPLAGERGPSAEDPEFDQGARPAQPPVGDDH